MGNEASAGCPGSACSNSCDEAPSYSLECTLLQVTLQRQGPSAGIRFLCGSSEDDPDLVSMQFCAEGGSEENSGISLGLVQQTVPGKRQDDQDDGGDHQVWVWGSEAVRRDIVKGFSKASEGTVKLVAPASGALSLRLFSTARSGGSKEAPRLIGEARPRISQDIVSTLGPTLVGDLMIPLVLKARVCGSARIHFRLEAARGEQAIEPSHAADGEVHASGGVPAARARKSPNLLESFAIGSAKPTTSLPKALGGGWKAHSVFIEKGSLGVGVEPLALSSSVLALKVMYFTDAVRAASYNLDVGDLILSLDGQTFTHADRFLERVKSPPFQVVALKQS